MCLQRRSKDRGHGETHEGIEGIVLGGARQALGMPSFAADLDVDQVRAIQAYILEKARESAGR